MVSYRKACTSYESKNNACIQVPFSPLLKSSQKITQTHYHYLPHKHCLQLHSCWALHSKNTKWKWSCFEAYNSREFVYIHIFWSLCTQKINQLFTKINLFLCTSRILLKSLYVLPNFLISKCSIFIQSHVVWKVEIWIEDILPSIRINNGMY